MSKYIISFRGEIRRISIIFYIKTPYVELCGENIPLHYYCYMYHFR